MSSEDHSKGFGYQNLDIYQVALEFVSYRGELLQELKRSINACDHLLRAGESIPLNIAHAFSAENSSGKANYLGHANGSALECAACLDILETWILICPERNKEGKKMLNRIVSMLVASRTKSTNKVFEPGAEYRTDDSQYLFDHEKLKAYQYSLKFISWMKINHQVFSSSQDLMAKLDKSSTAIVLNIAEGNGRFTDPDKVKFLKAARKATTQTAALLDIATLGDREANTGAQEILQSTGKLISGLIRSKTT